MVEITAQHEGPSGQRTQAHALSEPARASCRLHPRSMPRLPIDHAPRRRIPPESHQVRQMPHRRPTVWAVPGLLHRAHVSYDLRVQFKNAPGMRRDKGTTYRRHPRLIERLAYHHAPPTGTHRKHGPRFRTADHRPTRAVLHEMEELLEVYRAVRSASTCRRVKDVTLDVEYRVLGHGLRDQL
jgi:hypothetical protein